MIEKDKQQAGQYLEEVRRNIEDKQAELRDAKHAAEISESFVAHVEEELREAQKSATDARARVSAKQDELSNLLAALADKWRDKTIPPN